MDQLSHSCPADRPPVKLDEPNIIVKCLHTVLPLISSCCLDGIEISVLENGIDDYKVLCVSVCLCVCMCVRYTTISNMVILMHVNRRVLLKTKLRRTLQNV